MGRLIKAAKIIERMVCQNEFDEVAQGINNNNQILLYNINNE